MADRVFLKPASGLKPRDPRTLRQLSANGERVEWSPFWQRRLACGDVVRATESKPAPEVTTSAPKPPKKGADE